MPPAAAQQIERRPHFVKAPGRDAPAVRQHTERLRGADPLVVVPKKCRGLDWIHAVLPGLGTSRTVDGVKHRGLLYSDLEFLLGGLVRIHDDCKDKVFKDVLFSPEFLYGVGASLGQDERFDTATPRLSAGVLMREIVDFATRTLDMENETYTARQPEDFFDLTPVPQYELAQVLAEGLTFRMLEDGEANRLGSGAAVLMWFGCRYQEVTRQGSDAEVGAVVEAILAARKMFARIEPDQASLSTARGGGRAFLTWVKERGHAVSAQLDDVEACKNNMLAAAALIARLNFQDAVETSKALFLQHRWTRLLNAFPLLKKMMGESSDVDIVRMVIQLSNTLLKTNLTVLSSEAQMANLEEALEPQLDVIEAISPGGRSEVEPAQRTRIVIEGHMRMAKAGKEKDPQVGSSTNEMISMQASFAILVESQDFKETAESIEEFMRGPILRKGERGEPPLQVDVFLLCLKARYLFLTKFLLGRVALSMQVVQQVPVLAAVQKFRMTNASIAEAKLVSDTLVRILLPKAPGTEFTIKGMLGYEYPLEDCFKIVSGKWAEIDWEVLLSHAPDAHKTKLSLEAYYALHDHTGRGRAMMFTSSEEMDALKPSMGKIFTKIIGYDCDDDHELSFHSVISLCRDALVAAKLVPIHSYDIVVKVNACFLNALRDAGVGFMKWLGMNALDARFPATWLPKDSIAMRPLKLILETAEKLADHNAEMPFVAKQTNLALTDQGFTPPGPPVRTVRLCKVVRLEGRKM
jgi:hypothetical protein